MMKRMMLGVGLTGMLFAGSTPGGTIPDLCDSEVSSNGGTILVCPEGDGDHLSDVGATIDVSVISWGNPIPGIPANEFWLIDCDPADDILLCSGSESSSADSATDAQGHTTISGPIAAGGCADGLAVIVQGMIAPDPSCGKTWCLPVSVRSPDLDRNLEVDLVDLSLFAQGFMSGSYEKCVDLNGDGTVNLVDLARFAFHFDFPRHSCFI